MTIFVNGVRYTCDDALSGRDFTGWDFRDRPAIVWKNKIIYASVFSNETPDTPIFPLASTGMTFVNCNLDNVLTPLDAVVVGGSQRRWKIQNDLRDWNVTALNVPTTVLSAKYWMRLGISVNPLDIPAQRIVIPPGKTLEDVLPRAP